VIHNVTQEISMKALIMIALVAGTATLSGCVVAPARGDYRDRDSVRYEQRNHDRDHYYDRRNDDGRRHDGDHAGGTGTPD
jgi:hypothetical protein